MNDTPTLWCCNVLGPDDVIATRSYVEAAMLSQIVNERLLRYARKSWTENDARVWATPAEWPYDAEAHARDLAAPSAEYSGAIEMARRALEMDLGATGKWPEGKVHQHDAGELTFAIGALGKEVAVQFGTPVTWFSMAPPIARVFATSLLENAQALEAKPGSVN